MGIELAAMSPLDASYVVGRVYTALLPRNYRARNGVYFTPPALTRRLLSMVRRSGVDMLRARVLDPACGGGAFLAPVVSAKLAEYKQQPDAATFDHIVRSVRGFEIDPFSAWLSQVFLDAVVLPICTRIRAQLPILVDVRDALDASDSADFDLVLGNPPYGRVQLLSSQRERFRRSLHGHANLYGVFTDLALRFTRLGGVIAYVTPTSFLAGRYFKALRQLLADEAPPTSIEFISDREGVFDDVLQETMLVTFRRGISANSGEARRLQVGRLGDVEIEDVGSYRLPTNASEPWLIPREAKQAELVQSAYSQSTRLAHLGYRVSTGPLVWNRHKSQLRSTPSAQTYPLIWAEAVSMSRGFEFRAEKKNHQPYFEAQLPADDWLLITNPCVLVQRTTSKEQHRRLIAAELPSAFVEKFGAVVIENHLNMIYPTDKPLIPLRALTALLNSRLVDDLFRTMSGSVAVSAFELESIPLPTVGALLRFAEAVESGASKADLENLLGAAYQVDAAAAS